MGLAKSRVALIAEPAAGPNTPAQAYDLVAAFATKVWPIIREERQIREAFRYLNPCALYVILNDIVGVALRGHPFL